MLCLHVVLLTRHSMQLNQLLVVGACRILCHSEVSQEYLLVLVAQLTPPPA
jgi:hypothetical protein